VAPAGRKTRRAPLSFHSCGKQCNLKPGLDLGFSRGCLEAWGYPQEGQLGGGIAGKPSNPLCSTSLEALKPRPEPDFERGGSVSHHRGVLNAIPGERWCNLTIYDLVNYESLFASSLT
jgi:hypothetical protein